METSPEVQGEMWLRWYCGTRRDAKWRALSSDGRSLWNALLEIAKELNLDGTVHLVPGIPYTVEQLADEAAIPLASVHTQLSLMSALHMVEERPECLFITNFAKRQFKSDISTPRVQEFRQGKTGRNDNAPFPKQQAKVSETPPEYRVQSTDTESDSNTKDTHKTSRQRVLKVEYSTAFEELWEAYLHPPGDEKGRAFANYKALLHVPEGPTHETLMTAVCHYAAYRQGQDRQYHKKCANFLGKDNPWQEWIAFDPAGEAGKKDGRSTGGAGTTDRQTAGPGIEPTGGETGGNAPEGGVKKRTGYDAISF